jgi:GAF domain-containing protein
VVTTSAAELVARFPAAARLVEEAGLRGTAVHPLLSDAVAAGTPRLLGFVAFDLDRDRTLDTVPLDFLATLALLCAQALDRVRLADTEHRARVRAEQLQTLTATLSAARTPADVARATLDAGSRAVGAPLGVFFRVEDGAAPATRWC